MSENSEETCLPGDEKRATSPVFGEMKEEDGKVYARVDNDWRYLFDGPMPTLAQMMGVPESAIARQAKLDRIIGLSVITGKGEWGETITQIVGFGIDGDLDENSQQRWFATMEAMQQFHPELK